MARKSYSFPGASAQEIDIDAMARAMYESSFGQISKKDWDNILSSVRRHWRKAALAALGYVSNAAD